MCVRDRGGWVCLDLSMDDASFLIHGPGRLWNVVTVQ